MPEALNTSSNNQSGIDYAVCAEEFDGTAGSFRFAYSATIKKLKDQKAFLGNDHDKDGSRAGDDYAQEKSKKKVGGKRKNASEEDEGEREEPSVNKGR
jgi:hypothetical protein